jgi:hypothetical protein
MTVRYETYRVTIRLNDRLIGGIPVVSDESDELRAAVYRGWAKGQGVDDESGAAIATELVVDPDMPVAVVEEELGNGFRRDESGVPYIEARQIKALIREAAQRLGIIKRVRGSRQVVQHDIHVRSCDGDQRLFCADDDGQLMANVSGADSRPISVMTPQGPRTSIKRFEFMRNPTIVFDVRVLAGGIGDGLIDEEALTDILCVGEDLGLGADRSQGEGVYTVRKIERVED